MGSNNNDASQKTNSDSAMKIKDKTTNLHAEPDSGMTDQQSFEQQVEKTNLMSSAFYDK